MIKKYKFQDLISKTPKVRGIKTNEYNESGKYPIIDQGSKFIGGYTDDEQSLYKDTLPIIVFGDHTLAVKYIDFPFCAGADGTQIIKPNEKVVIGKFLYYAILNLNIKSLGYSRHYKVLKEAIFNIPEIDDQKRIVRILDEADTIRKKRKHSIELLDDYLRSVFLEMFGDPVRNEKCFNVQPVSDILACPTKSGLYVPKDQYSTLGIEMVHMSDIFDGIVQRGKLKQVDISSNDVLKYSIDSNDLLIARRSLTFAGAAKPCRIPVSNKPLVFESSLIKLTPDNNLLLPIYLYYYLSNDRVRNFYVSKYITSSTISGINQSGLNRVLVMLPPLDLQEKFSDIVQNTENIKKIMTNQLIEIETQFQALMQKAFKGEL